MSERPLHPVLVLRYDPEWAGRIMGILSAAGYSVQPCESFRELNELIKAAPAVPLVVLTGGLSEPGTRDFLATLRGLPQRVPILGLVERLDRARAEALRRLGVDEVMEKPLDPSELVVVARHLLERSELERSTRIVGRSPAIQEVLEKIAQYAPVSSTVLIEGESGTGKELIAEAIHARSPRATQAFVAINCAALTETLLESELFGHERGAFTGAVAQRKGRFELANHGTLFLDEVGEMAPATQVKLLRVLEEREFVRVGGAEKVQVDVRVIAATNKVLREAVEIGEFRRDLYYRLNVLHVDIPPLRERREDIPLLVQRFLQEFAREHGRERLEMSEEALAILQNYDWPGNVRELRNQIERMVVLTYGSRIRSKDIPDYIYERAHPGRMLPVAPGQSPGDGRGSPELEFLYRYLVELRREVGEIKEILVGELKDILEDVPYRGQLLDEIPVANSDEGEAVVVPAHPSTEEAGRDAGPEGRPPGGGLPQTVRVLPAGAGHIRGVGEPGSSMEPNGFPESGRAEGSLPVGTGLPAGPAAAAATGLSGATGPAAAAGSAASTTGQPGGPDTQPEDAGIVPFRVGMSFEELEKQAIQRTLAGVQGNRRKAASILGIGERTLYRKLKQYDLV
jgi:DNA-binding NtrC family response regulator